MNNTQQDELIDAAEERAKLYDDDDRECIKADVMNAFFAGAAYVGCWDGHSTDEKYERLAALKPVGASTVLTDERIEELFSPLMPRLPSHPALLEFARAIAREVAAQAGQVAVPEGWKLVSIEPTLEMLAEAASRLQESLSAQSELEYQADAHPHGMECLPPPHRQQRNRNEQSN